MSKKRPAGEALAESRPIKSQRRDDIKDAKDPLYDDDPSEDDDDVPTEPLDDEIFAAPAVYVQYFPVQRTRYHDALRAQLIGNPRSPGQGQRHSYLLLPPVLMDIVMGYLMTDVAALGGICKALTHGNEMADEHDNRDIIRVCEWFLTFNGMSTSVSLSHLQPSVVTIQYINKFDGRGSDSDRTMRCTVNVVDMSADTGRLRIMVAPIEEYSISCTVLPPQMDELPFWCTTTWRPQDWMPLVFENEWTPEAAFGGFFYDSPYHPKEIYEQLTRTILGPTTCVEPVQLITQISLSLGCIGQLG